MKMTAVLDLSEVLTADALYERLGAFADEAGRRVIPEDATLKVLTQTHYDDRPGGSSTPTVKPYALEFTWEI